jgi:protein O-GlcNAc transferase
MMENENAPAPSVTTQLERASRLLDENRHGEAAECYTAICRDYPNHPEAWTGLAIALLQQQRYVECLQAVANALGVDARQPRPHLIAAAALTHLGRPGDALRAADAALTLVPDSLKALHSKAAILLNQGRYPEVLPLTERALQLEPADVSARLNQGVALHGLGQALAALTAFDQVLASDPRHSDALMNRGSVLIALGRAEEALQAADSALEIQPDSPVALLNRAAALLSLRRYREALTAADQLLRINPRHIKGLVNKTVALLGLGDHAAAWATLTTVLTFDSFNPDALELKLQVLLGLRRFTEVVTEGQRLLAKHSDRPGIKLAVARALATLGRRAEAEPLVDAVLGAAHQAPEAVVLKVDILLSRREGEAGRILLEQALADDPERAPLWSAKSALFLAKGDHAAALAAAERALALDADHLQAAIHRIAALNGLCRFSEALAMAGEWLERGASEWQLHANLGGALAGLERFAEARQAFARARELDGPAFHAFRWRHESYGAPADALLPELDPRTESLALRMGRLERADWEDYDATIERARTLTAQTLGEGQLTPIPPFKSLLLPFSSELTAAIARNRGEFLATGMAPIRQHLSFAESASSAAERLRIGYVSADFRDHPTAHLMRGLFRVHDRTRFEIHVYALCPDDRSDYYQRIRADADRFVDLTGTSNAEAAARIHADGVHLLIDLMGYTACARSEIFALRPAPVQVSYLGYPGTLGADFIPYIIADPVVLPEELLSHFSECPVYLPDCYQVNDRWQDIAETGIRRTDQNLPESGFVFCCFNQIQKLEPVMFAVWMRILLRVPNSVLWLYSDSEEAQANLRSAAAAGGIDGERLVFAKRLPKDRHLERHRLADLFLDTRIYNAHTTASDALWAGVPVLTCLGGTFPARVAASLLQAVGLPELISHSLEEYEEQAVRLATQPTELAGLREKLAHNRLRTPLFDTERFARHLERAYEMMWERHVRGLPPASLQVPALPGSV